MSAIARSRTAARRSPRHGRRRPHGEVSGGVARAPDAVAERRRDRASGERLSERQRRESGLDRRSSRHKFTALVGCALRSRHRAFRSERRAFDRAVRSTSQRCFLGLGDSARETTARAPRSRTNRLESRVPFEWLTSIPRAHEYQEYRQAVRELCGQFDSKYWQDVDERAGYPDAFVKALTDAGWLAALIPEQYGGGGLSVTEASVILEEINRSGANSGACHAQMYIMGALLRHGSDGAEAARYLPGIASGRAAPAVVRRHRADDRHRHDEDAHDRRPRKGDRYVVNGQKVWISRDPAFRPDAAARADDAAAGGEEEDRGTVDLSGRPARRRAARA